MNRPIAFLTPYTNLENPYIALQRDLLAELGFDVRPLSLKAVLAGQCMGLSDPQNVVLVHWLENRLFKVGKARRGLSAKGAAQFAIYAAILRTARARTVYFVHDHAVHDVKPALRTLSQKAIALLRGSADIRVVHDPTFEQRYDARYLPHPLYWDQPAAAAAAAALPHVGTATPRFAIMGALRPYKEIDKVLEQWPVGAPLLIAGRGDDSYVALLRDIIRRRGLRDSVELIARFLTDDEFSSLLQQRDVLILPHRLDANLVSGAFFAGIGQVPVILAREAPFVAWVKQRVPGIYSFAHDAELPSRVSEISADWAELARSDSRAAARQEFGWQACLDAYGQLLGVGLRRADIADVNAAASTHQTAEASSAGRC